MNVDAMQADDRRGGDDHPRPLQNPLHGERVDAHLWGAVDYDGVAGTPGIMEPSELDFDPTEFVDVDLVAPSTEGTDDHVLHDGAVAVRQGDPAAGEHRVHGQPGDRHVAHAVDLHAVPDLHPRHRAAGNRSAGRDHTAAVRLQIDAAAGGAQQHSVDHRRIGLETNRRLTGGRYAAAAAVGERRAADAPQPGPVHL